LLIIKVSSHATQDLEVSTDDNLLRGGNKDVFLIANVELNGTDDFPKRLSWF
jgi:hypothetical protein